MLHQSFHKIERPDTLLKIMILLINIQNINNLDVKICDQSCLMFVYVQVMESVSKQFSSEHENQHHYSETG